MKKDAQQNEPADPKLPESATALTALDLKPSVTNHPGNCDNEANTHSGHESRSTMSYTESPNPFEVGDLLAHDPQALALVLAEPTSQFRTLIAPADKSSEASQNSLDRIRNIEESTLRRINAKRLSQKTWKLFWLAALVGLPFTVAALSGALGLVMARIPTIGTTVGEFVSTSGSSLGGLPLGMAFATLPSLIILRKWFLQSDGETFPKPSKTGRRLDPQVIHSHTGNYIQCLEELRPLIDESRQLSSSRKSLSGQDAKRLETLLKMMIVVSRRYDIQDVASMYGTFRIKMWRATNVTRRRLGIVCLRRSPANIEDITLPYRRHNRDKGTGEAITHILRVPAGLLVALALFLVAGTYRLSPHAAEILRPNQLIFFQQVLDVVSMTDFSRDSLSTTSLESVKAVDGPGWFWSWPTPLTQREHLTLTKRRVEVESFLGLRSDGSTEIVKAEIIFSVQDTGKWLFFGRTADADMEVKLRLSQLLADHIAEAKERRAALPQRPVNITESLKREMATVLTKFVSIVNIDEEVLDLGIHVDSTDRYNFPTYLP